MLLIECLLLGAPERLGMTMRQNPLPKQEGHRKRCILSNARDAGRVLFKQRNNRFYPPSAWSLAMMLVRVPFQLVEAAIFAGVIYFWVGKIPLPPSHFSQPQSF